MKKQLNILDFFSEVGLLKRVKRSGWWTIGINNPESVADHSFRVAVMAFIIADLENCDPYKAAVIGLFNDIHEARINDLHKLAQRYIDLRQAEVKAHTDQISNLPISVKNKFGAIMNELWSDDSAEAVIARDADILECMLQGKEYYSNGYLQAEEFFKRSSELLKTATAKELAVELIDWNPQDWIKKAIVLKR